MVRYGLHLHLDVEIEKTSLGPAGTMRFNPAFDEALAIELAESYAEPRVIRVCKQALWPALQQRIVRQGFQARPLGAPYGTGDLPLDLDQAGPEASAGEFL